MKNKKKITICVLFVIGLIAISSFTGFNRTSSFAIYDPDPGDKTTPWFGDDSIPIQPPLVSIDIPMGSLSVGYNLLLDSINTGI